MSGIAAAAIAAGASLAGTAASGVATGKLNKKNREWQEKMWNATNEYNAPLAQMARFEEAGLNPHLIYGQGNSGNASMASPPEQKVPNYNFADAAMSYVATRKQQTEIDNLEKAKELMEADIIKRAAETTNLLSNSAKTDLERAQSAELFQTVKDTALANLNNVNIQGRKLEAEVKSIIQSTSLSQTQQSKVIQDILESRSRILNLKAERDNKGVETEIKRVELGLRKQGINPNDPAWSRILGRILDESGIADRVIEGAKGTNSVLKNKKDPSLKDFKDFFNSRKSVKEWYTK